MNKEETKKAIEVMQAYVDGKQIQIKKFGDDVWQYVNIPVWDFLTFEYRIKPEKKIRPYKNAKEFLQAQKEHGMYICPRKYEDSVEYIMPSVVSDSHVELIADCDYTELLQNYVWQNGTPCGIEEE